MLQDVDGAFLVKQVERGAACRRADRLAPLLAPGSSGRPPSGIGRVAASVRRVAGAAWRSVDDAFAGAGHVRPARPA